MLNALLSSLFAPAGRGPSISGTILQMVSIANQRAKLRKLDERALRDIGLTRHEAEIEAARPFWDVPNQWRR